ncbi:MAG: TRAP transporter fused permease subunit [Rhodobacteraceae bacterium]|nr:TRAP transporter fused permease subunit [Paracoccaceae bacterium]
MVRPMTSLLGGAIVVLAILWTLSVPHLLGLNLYTGQYIYTLLALASVVVFLRRPMLPGHAGLSRWMDGGLALAGALAMGWIVLNFGQFLDDANYRDFDATGIAVALIVMAVLIEGVRRTAGLAFALIVLAALLVAIFAVDLPAPLTGRRFRLDSFAYKMAFLDGNILGSPLKIVSSVVVAFVLMGSVLQSTGGGRFFSDLAAALMGRSRGGSAKIAVTASGLFGAISGSAVSNVVSTGMITIPLMKKAGYRAEVAGATEAVASTGGQLVPPVMGAAAFLMAVTAEVDYSVVVLAALVPAILYYLALFLQIDLMAGRDDIRGVEGEELPRAGAVLRSGWIFILPFAVLIAGLFALVWRPEYAALMATLALVAVLFVFGYEGRRPTLAQFMEALRDTADSAVSILFIAGAAGIVIGALNSSGVLFNITEAIIDLGADNLPVLLIVAALLCILLGMGMPTVGVYALLSTLVAAPLVHLGIERIAAHLFVLYYGMMSMITPPVAVASFAAASIARTGAMRTGWEAVKLGWAAYIIPFVFVVNPALILHGDAVEIAFALARATLGVWLVSACIIGYLNHRLSTALRATYALLGIVLLVPGLALPGGLWIGGGITLVLGVGVLAYEFGASRRKEGARA